LVRIFKDGVPCARLSFSDTRDGVQLFGVHDRTGARLPKILAALTAVSFLTSMGIASVTLSLAERKWERAYAQVHYGDSEASVRDVMGKPTSDFVGDEYVPQIGWEHCQRWSSDGPRVRKLLFYNAEPHEWTIGFDAHDRAVAKSELACPWVL
jgi:hypothetical protein